MIPERIESLLDGGSVYQIIKGNIQACQSFFDIKPFYDSGGIHRCRLELKERIIPTVWQAGKAFQGWRYFQQKDIPEDMTNNGGWIWEYALIVGWSYQSLDCYEFRRKISLSVFPWLLFHLDIRVIIYGLSLVIITCVE